MSFAGLRVLSLETRRAADMENMILRQQGVPFIAPSVAERSVDDRSIAIRFVERLEAGEFDMVVCAMWPLRIFLMNGLAPRCAGP
jgi:hypothetical protein